jgi:predicted SAM-dependent methyltransferase
VEISPCAEYARNSRGLDVRCSPLEESNFPDECFDAVLASHFIEHLNDPRGFLTETHRILKDQGRVFITTPNISGFQAKLFGGKWRSAIFDHLYLFSVRTLSKLLDNTGFKIESCHTWGGLAAGTAPMWLKKTADVLAKRFGCGDVMIIRAKR